MKTDTVSIHGGFADDPGTGASVTPIFQTVSYSYKTAQELADVFGGKAPGYVYTRITNPTTTALEIRLAQLEEGIGCIATSSGMSAIASVVMGLVKTGDEIVAASGIFGGTVSLFQNTLTRYGIKTTFVDSGSSDEFTKAITKNTKLIFIETIGNPKMDVPDISVIAEIAKQANIPLVVDSTLTPPVLFTPGSVGADIVIHSTTKFINGHGTAMGGAIIDTGNYDWRKGIFEDIKERSEKVGQFAFLAFLRNIIYRDFGGCPAPMNSFLMLQGLETLAVRMKKHCSNTVKLAKYLQDNEKVSWVNYPGLQESAFYDLAVKQFGSRAGGVLTFGVDGRKRAFKFIDSLKLAKNLANLGDAKTVVLHPKSTIFREFSPEQLETMGVTDDMIRVSVGIEDFEDIKNDFEQAIDKAFEEQE